MNSLKQSKRNKENTGFTCANCSADVLPITNGSYRNHCPGCLYSLHVDIKPGDRLSDCLGLMKPISAKYNSNKGWQIIHRCVLCGVTQANRIALDTIQPDDWDIVNKIINYSYY